jgi:hypothetical protein
MGELAIPTGSLSVLKSPDKNSEHITSGILLTGTTPPSRAGEQEKQKPEELPSFSY